MIGARLALLLTLLLAVPTASQTPSETVSAASSSCLAIPTVTLHNGVAMPILQLGTCQLILDTNPDPHAPSGYVGLQPERAYRQMEQALTAGVRAFDTAYIYRSHGPMAHVLGEWWRMGQLEARHDVWLTSKIFHPPARPVGFDISHMPDLADLSPAQVGQRTQQHFEESLLQLNVGYIDLILLHWPAGKGEGNASDNRQRRWAAWQVLEEMYRRGWCRAIGVSNFSVEHLKQLQQDGATIMPMVNQIEASVTIQHREIRDYCLAHDIVPQAYSPLRGLSPMPEVVVQLAEKYQKDAGQIALRYLLQHGYAVAHLTNNPKRMVSNTDIFDSTLTLPEMQALDELNIDDGGWGLPKPQEID